MGDCASLTNEWTGPWKVGRRTRPGILHAMAGDMLARVMNEGMIFFRITSALRYWPLSFISRPCEKELICWLPGEDCEAVLVASK